MKPYMKPVLVRAFGRSGTTLLMQLLKSSDNVFVPNGYPFESRFLSYFAKYAAIPFSGRDSETEVAAMVDKDILNIKPNSYITATPYNSDFIEDKDEIKKRLLMSSWNQFSQVSRASLELDFEYYAEKVAQSQYDFIRRSIQGVKTIHLIRDPRGELLSIMKFNEKRGFNAFGWTENDTAYTYAQKIIEARRKFIHSIKDFYLTPNESHLVVRYEDLVSDMQLESIKISKWLNVNLDFQQVINQQSKFVMHMTSDNPAKDTDNWRSELSEDVILLFEELMGDELEAMGMNTLE